MLSKSKTKSEKRASNKKRRKFGISGRGVFLLQKIKIDSKPKKR